MNGAPDVSAGQERQGIAGVDSQRRILGLDVLPLASLVVLDLECSDGLAEQQSP